MPKQANTQADAHDKNKVRLSLSESKYWAAGDMCWTSRGLDFKGRSHKPGKMSSE